MTDNLVILLGALILIAIFLGLRRLGSNRAQGSRTKNSIVVDGSNVMYWGGRGPSATILNRVLVVLDEKGLNPIVYFDANVGHKLWGRAADAQFVAPRIGVAPERVVIAPSGVTADEILLEFAAKHRLKVVSNDRFLDWRVKYPKTGKKGFLVKGEWRQGNVMLQGL